MKEIEEIFIKGFMILLIVGAIVWLAGSLAAEAKAIKYYNRKLQHDGNTGTN